MKRFALSGIIGWDVMPHSLREFLDAADGADVEIVVSSPGGYVGDGLEMYNLIRNYPGKTTAVLSGFAMSMASYIPLAADDIIAEDNAVYMIHNVRGGVMGDHNDILKYGRETEALSKMIAAGYAKHTGKPLAEIRQMMDAETFFYGDEIAESGFAHGMTVGENQDDDERDNLMVAAKAAWSACHARLAADTKTAAYDIIRAAAIAGVLPPESHRGEHMTTPATKERAMDLNMLKEQHPDLVAALFDEHAAAMNVEALNSHNVNLVESIMELGAEAERKRIADVRSQMLAGHEALIERMAFDGTSTGNDAAKAIVAAERELRKQQVAELETETNPVVPPAAPPEGEGKKVMRRAEFNQLSASERAATVKDGVQIID